MRTATEIAADVREGRLRASEVVEESLAAIAADEHNAFTRVLTEQARRDAAAVDAGERTGRLAGVPVAVKAELDVAGEVTTHGGRAQSTPATADCEVVRRLRAEGAVLVGLTNMPELGQFPFTESERYGMTINPAAPAYTPGGSSGGSAAAVAAGLVPVAIGTDGGGSVRIPSSCCGLVGLKASRGRVPTAPYPDSWLTLGTAGPITRTVADQRLLHEIISDAAPARAADPTPLRVGWSVRPTGPGITVDQAVYEATRVYAHRLAEAGCQVSRLDVALGNQTSAFVPQMYAGMRAAAERLEHPERLEARTRSTVGRARVLGSPAAVRRALVRAQALTAEVDALWSQVDVLLTPTLACLPPGLGQLDGRGAFGATLASMPMVVFTSMYNVTGHPALSVPAGRSGDGRPIGVQLVGPHGHDERLLDLAARVGDAAR